jgi:cytochrome c-type biogenesis protein CcmH
VRRITLALIVALGLVGYASPGEGQPSRPDSIPGAAASVTDSALDARTTAVASTLRCPVCQGESIQDSPSELAKQMRAVVKDRLRAGESPEQIKAYFVSRYGEWILLEPKMTGLNVALYVLPVVLILGGLALIVILVKRWTSQAGPSTPQGSDGNNIDSNSGPIQ